MSALQEIINYTIVFAGLLSILFFGLNFLTKGWLLTYLRVKASQGKKTLAIIHSVTDVYYKAGQFIEDGYKFKDRNGEEKTIPMNDVVYTDFIKHTMGVPYVEIDEQGNKLVKKDFTIIKQVNVDPARLNSLILRIKNRPRSVSNFQKGVIIMLIFLILGVIFVGYKINLMAETLTALKSLSGNI